MLRVLDLFAGIGGFSHGLELVGGFKTVAFCEMASFQQSVLNRHWPGVPVFSDVALLRGDQVGPVDIISSGDPCQRDSRANAGRDGESMWPHTFRLIRELRPVYVLRENVLGNVETGTLERVERDLRSLAYKVRSYVVPASAVGAAHDRPRTWTLAYTDSAGCEKLDHAAQPSTAAQWQHPLHTGENGLYWVVSEPPVLRRVDDVPHRVDRIGALGNAVNPIIVQIFGRAILSHAAECAA